MLKKQRTLQDDVRNYEETWHFILPAVFKVVATEKKVQNTWLTVNCCRRIGNLSRTVAFITGQLEDYFPIQSNVLLRRIQTALKLNGKVPVDWILLFWVWEFQSKHEIPWKCRPAWVRFYGVSFVQEFIHL